MHAYSFTYARTASRIHACMQRHFELWNAHWQSKSHTNVLCSTSKVYANAHSSVVAPLRRGAQTYAVFRANSALYLWNPGCMRTSRPLELMIWNPSSGTGRMPSGLKYGGKSFVVKDKIPGPTIFSDCSCLAMYNFQLGHSDVRSTSLFCALIHVQASASNWRIPSAR